MLDFYGYIKSGKTLSDGTPIYFPKCINHYWETQYKTYIEKDTGKEIVLSNGYKDVKYIFSDDDIEVDSNRVRHNIINLDTFQFQFNLNKYCCFIGTYSSKYNEVGYIIGNNFNEAPEYLLSSSRDRLRYYYNIDFETETGYWPFVELCFASDNGYAIQNYISDKIFFNYPDRNKALAGIVYGDKIFAGIDYVNMSDRELVSFMTDRLNRRMKYEQLVSNHKNYYYATR